MNEKQLYEFCGGLGLAGWARDGKIYPATGVSSEVLDKWPEEITVFGNTYTLEYVEDGQTHHEKGVFQNAEYC